MDEPEFCCQQCHNFYKTEDKGKATKEGKPYSVCKYCCYEEQKQQFYAEM